MQQLENIPRLTILSKLGSGTFASVSLASELTPNGDGAGSVNEEE